MNSDNGTQQGIGLRLTLGLLHSVGLLITASAVVIVFVVAPFDLLERSRLLPHWDIFWLFFIFVPFVAAWDHAGLYLLGTVTICEVGRAFLKPETKRAKIAAAGSVVVCLVAYLWILMARRSNIH